MYLDHSFLEPVKSALLEIYETDFWRGLDSTATSVAIAAGALREAGVDQLSPQTLCVAMAMRQLGIETPQIDTRMENAFRFEQSRLLSEKHESMVHSIDGSQEQFTMDDALSAFDQVSREMGFPFYKAHQETHLNVSKFAFFGRLDVGHTEIVHSIWGRNTSGSSITSGMEARRGDQGAELSLSKLVGIGFWRPCPKNSVATFDDLCDTFREPLALARVFRNAFARN